MIKTFATWGLHHECQLTNLELCSLRNPSGKKLSKYCHTNCYNKAEDVWKPKSNR